MIKKKPTKKNTRSAKGSGIPTWISFCCGIVFTLFAQLLYHLANVDTISDKIQTTIAPKTEEQPQPKPKINFYTELKNMEVKVPEQVTNGIQQVKTQVDDIKQKVDDAKEQTQNSVKEISENEGSQKQSPEKETNIVKKEEKTQSGKYHSALQTGSFINIEDANEQRAQVMLSGLNATIETSMTNGKTLHRVIVGPFNDAKELEAAKNNLSELNLSAITVRQ